MLPTGPLWVFGYGSLLFRPDFPHEARLVAQVEGWERRLDQGSPDHRGTPARLGRVATLVRSPGAATEGAAFLVAERHAAEVLAALDHREKGGYERVMVDVQFREGAGGFAKAVTWVAGPDNPYHLGRAELGLMVSQIREAVGPSGPNVEYVWRLWETLKELGIEDPHISEVAALLGDRGMTKRG